MTGGGKSLAVFLLFFEGCVEEVFLIYGLAENGAFFKARESDLCSYDRWYKLV